MYERCIEEQQSPQMRVGDTIDSGVYYRNLKKRHVAKRYVNDDDDTPKYGWKLPARFWNDAENRGDLSVNQSSCVGRLECCIAIQQDSRHYYHVAVIDLASLNGSGRLSCRYLAQYKPTTDPRNACHFEIAPEDGTVSKMQELRNLLDDPFPPAKRLPTTSTDQAEAQRAWEEHRAICDIKRWVRKKDGTLSAAK